MTKEMQTRVPASMRVLAFLSLLPHLPFPHPHPTRGACRRSLGGGRGRCVRSVGGTRQPGEEVAQVCEPAGGAGHQGLGKSQCCAGPACATPAAVTHTVRPFPPSQTLTLQKSFSGFPWSQTCPERCFVPLTTVPVSLKTQPGVFRGAGPPRAGVGCGLASPA